MLQFNLIKAVCALSWNSKRITSGVTQYTSGLFVTFKRILFALEKVILSPPNTSFRVICPKLQLWCDLFLGSLPLKLHVLDFNFLYICLTQYTHIRTKCVYAMYVCMLP